MSHPASKTRLLLFYLLLTLTFSFCRKTDTRNVTEEWNIAEAKEWWYGKFKKSAAYKKTETSSPYAISFNYASGNYSPGTAMQKQLKKYPVWEMGALFKTGRFEIAEFPLIYPVKLAPMPQAAQLNDQQKKKIAECMLERVLMIKMPSGEKEVRIATIIPEFAYAASRNFDISNNSMHKLDKQFKGWLVIRKWDEAIVNIYEIEAEKTTRVLRMDAMQPKKNATGPGNFAREECGYTSVMVWNKVCIEGPCEPPQDIPCINNCIDWYYVADVEWEWTCVETGDIDCGDGSLPYEECMCYYYGLNCYNNGDEPFDPYDAPNITISDSLRDSFPCLYGLLKDSLPNLNRAAQMELFSNFNVSERINLRFDIDWSLDSTTNTDAYTDYSASNFDGYQFNGVIKFNPYYVNISTREYTVSTIVHEAIHAYIDYMFDAYTRNVPGVDSAYLAGHFPLHWNYFKQNPIGENLQHRLMAEHYVNTIQDITKLFYNPNADAATVNKVSRAIAWSGLEKTTAWKNLTDTCDIKAIFWAAKVPHLDESTRSFGNSCRTYNLHYQDSLKLSSPCR